MAAGWRRLALGLRGSGESLPDARPIVEFRCEPLPPLSSLEDQWHRIEAVGQPSFFTSWHWIGTLLEFLPEGSRPSLLRGTQDGDTVALALTGTAAVRRRCGLIRSRSVYLNESGDRRFDFTIEHNGLLVATGYENAAIEGLTTWFVEHEAEFDELHLPGTLIRLPASLVEGRGLLRSEIAVSFYYVEVDRLGSSGGALDPVLSSNARQQLRRAMRWYERFGEVRLVEAASISEAHSFFAGLKELHIARWEARGRAHSFSGPYFEPFHRLLIERGLAAGVVNLFRISAGSFLVGYLYNFRFNRRIYAYQSGFAYDQPASRPGAVSHAMAIRAAHQSGAGVYDFLAGYNRLKESFSTASDPMLWQVIRQPRLAYRVEHFARAVKDRLRGRTDAIHNQSGDRE